MLAVGLVAFLGHLNRSRFLALPGPHGFDLITRPDAEVRRGIVLSQLLCRAPHRLKVGEPSLHHVPAFSSRAKVPLDTNDPALSLDELSRGLSPFPLLHTPKA